MEPEKRELAQIGKQIRAALDAAVDPAEQIRAARGRLLERVAGRNATRNTAHDDVGPRGWLRGAVSGRRRTAALLVGAAAMGGVAIVLWMRLPISFQIGAGATRTPGRLGDVVETTGGEPVELRFSEGSSIVLGTSSRVRVLSAEPKGARVLIESGALDAAIVHREQRGTRWMFEAGPFHVLVTGTRFHVVWNPKDQSFALAAKEGSVLVSGPCLSAPRAVSGGDSLRLACLSPSTAPVAPVAVRRVVAPDDNAEAGLDPSVAGALASLMKPPPRGAGWRELIAAGRLADGVRAAERADFGHVCRLANQEELLALADAARLSGRSARAMEALRVLRQRFAGSADAATAAFALGRILFDRRGAYADAARWFATYLDELPNGPLMGDAVGRLMEARQRAGDRQGARADAERYLRRFPEGPYAPEARGMLSE